MTRRARRVLLYGPAAVVLPPLLAWAAADRLAPVAMRAAERIGRMLEPDE